MDMEGLDVYKIIERIQRIENIGLPERLTNLEQQLKHFCFACQSIDNNFKKGISISLNESSHQLVDTMRKVLDNLRNEVLDFRKLKYEMQQELKNDSVMGTLKYMSKCLHDLKEEVSQMRDKGVKKNIHLDLTLDGYEMIKKPPSIPYTFLLNDKEYSEERFLIKLLDSLPIAEKTVLCHRFGLVGEKKKTLKATGAFLNLSPERIRQLETRALRKCRHASRIQLAEDITHLELRRAIFGENP